MSWMSMIPSIFDAAGEGAGDLLSQGDGGGLGMGSPGGGDLSMGGGQQPTLWSPDFASMGQPAPQANNQIQKPAMPAMGSPGDVSGFASYGMTAPAPPPIMDSQKQMGGLMALNRVLGDPHENRNQDQFAQRPKGGLLSYLDTLGV